MYNILGSKEYMQRGKDLIKVESPRFIEEYNKSLKQLSLQNDDNGLMLLFDRMLKDLGKREQDSYIKSVCVDVLMMRAKKLKDQGENERCLRDAKKAYDISQAIECEIFTSCLLASFLAAAYANVNKSAKSVVLIAKLTSTCFSQNSRGTYYFAMSEFFDNVSQPERIAPILRRVCSQKT